MTPPHLKKSRRREPGHEGVGVEGGALHEALDVLGDLGAEDAHQVLPDLPPDASRLVRGDVELEDL